MKKALYFLLLMISPVCSWAQTIVWKAGAESVEIGQKVWLLEDKAGKLTIDQVSSGKYAAAFVPSSKPILNFGITESFYWLKFRMDNETDDNLLLEMAQSFLPVCDFYYRGNGGVWQVQRAGYEVGVGQKQVKHHFPLFPLPKGDHDFYVRFQSFSPPTPVRIWNEEVYEVKANYQKLIYGLYEGILLFVVINNILLFFSFRRLSYLHYAVVVLLYAATVAAVSDGFLPYVISKPDMMFWYRLIPELNMPVLWLYCILFLEVKKYLPGFYNYTLALLAYFILIIVVSQFLPLSQVLLVNQINAVMLFGSIVWLGIAVRRKGNVLGYYLALTYLVFCFFVVLEAVYIQTGYPSYFFEISHVSVAILLEVFFLSYLLSKRFEWEKKDIENQRAVAQLQLLEKTLENEKIVREQNVSLEQKVTARTAELNQSLQNLKSVQNQLIQAEKMASLGELTAGIAHEIQNPLNFVNNFSEVSTELLDEIRDERSKGAERDEELEGVLLEDLTENLQKITHHGKRADAIVKGMLEHSRIGSGQKELTDINLLATEYGRLAYHGLRAKDKGFSPELVFDLDPHLVKTRTVGKDIGRVMVNLVSNAYYAVNQRKLTEPDLNPVITVSTRTLGNEMEIRVKDNGAGIPENLRQKIFQPFFSTKPTGQGTGLGLSLSYEIVVMGHNGRLELESSVGTGSEFIVIIPVEA
ncbi:sensor histidine kinase [Dyadobacter pollutisoli]|uniref:histidine kinase n=1 Tax=Dyadobacter pollutisoli TaxID=2910158 RepID=A0A9E8NFE8_9BACT|nr:7TM-DISM domain-containing protein [Dyadobacter pollutisoli]WAC14308.1 ATP-binding protein [Dyadobacter pollutisoli]